MRISFPTEQEPEEGPQTVFFQIANGNRAPGLQREDEISNPATGVAISPAKLEYDREDGPRLSGERNF